jgi:hypothetical protein
MAGHARLGESYGFRIYVDSPSDAPLHPPGNRTANVTFSFPSGIQVIDVDDRVEPPSGDHFSVTLVAPGNQGWHAVTPGITFRAVEKGEHAVSVQVDFEGQSIGTRQVIHVV